MTLSKEICGDVIGVVLKTICGHTSFSLRRVEFVSVVRSVKANIRRKTMGVIAVSLTSVLSYGLGFNVFSSSILPT